MVRRRVRYVYTITNPLDGAEIAASYYNRDLALDVLTSNLDRSIAYSTFVGSTFTDEDGHLHCVKAVPAPL